MRSLSIGLLGLLALPSAALAQPFGYNPFDPGSSQSPPGPGCQIGTSGCFPSSPPGPINVPNDVGAPQNMPPPTINPAAVPYYGWLPAYPYTVRPPVTSTGAAMSGAASLSEQGSPIPPEEQEQLASPPPPPQQPAAPPPQP
jgi:hypothetical protein